MPPSRPSAGTGPFVDEQKVQGCYFGSADLRRDVAALVRHHLAGELLLDELISHRIGLDDLDEAFARLRAGEGPAMSASSADVPARNCHAA
jgi:Zn-dependent alcohol dehydrogenase